MTRVSRFAALVAVVLLVSGCAAGCRTMGKVTGTRDAMLNASPDKVVLAVKGAFEELQIKHITSNSSKLDGEVIGETAQDKTITVKVNSEGENVSRMTVKVGAVGDKVISESIINATKKRL